MARSRNIKPGFFTNDELAQCEYGARLLFAGLWTIADREGRLEDRPARIKAILFPFDKCNVEKWLGQLQERLFIHRYEASDTRFIQIANFHKHQTPHIKEPESTIPAPDLSHASISARVYGIRNQELGNGNQESDRAGAKKFEPPTVEAVAAYCQERGNAVDPQSFVDFYASKGWKVGNQGMKDWHASVRTWERNPRNAGKSPDDPRGNIAAAKRYLEGCDNGE